MAETRLPSLRRPADCGARAIAETTLIHARDVEILLGRLGRRFPAKSVIDDVFADAKEGGQVDILVDVRPVDPGAEILNRLVRALLRGGGRKAIRPGDGNGRPRGHPKGRPRHGGHRFGLDQWWRLGSIRRSFAFLVPAAKPLVLVSSRDRKHLFELVVIVATDPRHGDRAEPKLGIAAVAGHVDVGLLNAVAHFGNGM